MEFGGVIAIGNGATVKSSFLSNLVGLYSRSIIVTRTPEAVILIGDNVGISGATIYARKGIYIGDNTAIGGNVKILDNDFHPIDAETRIRLLNDSHGGDATELIPAKEIHPKIPNFLYTGFKNADFMRISAISVYNI